MKLYKTGRDCALALVRGEAEIGITFTSEFIAVPGTRVVGTFPKEIEYVNGYAGAIPKDAAVEPARAFLSFLTSPIVQGVLQVVRVGVGRLPTRIAAKSSGRETCTGHSRCCSV